MNRQEYWLSKGYTRENIENHLRFERRKAKEIRDRKKKNNEKNQELIKQIKKDLIGQTFKFNHKVIKILSVRETVDGVGFWYNSLATFKDGSSGEFRYFYDFREYSKKEFIKWLEDA